MTTATATSTGLIATLDRQSLVHALSILENIIPERHPSESLRHVLIDCGDDIRIRATNLQDYVTIRVQGNAEIHGRIAIRHRRLANLVRMLSAQRIRLAGLSDYGEVSDSDSTFRIDAIPPDEYPKLPEFEAENCDTVPVGKLEFALARTSHQCAEVGTRYSIKGVGFDGKHAAATDGRSCAWVKLKTHFRGIVSESAIKTIRTLLGVGVVEIAQNKYAARFTGSGWQVVTNMHEGAFPPWEDVIPSVFKTTITCDADDFRLAMSLAALMTNEEQKGVRVNVSEDGLLLRSKCWNHHSASIPLSAHVDGDKTRFAINPKYAAGAVAGLNGDITIRVAAENKPVLFEQGMYGCVVMPVNADWTDDE